MTGTIFRNFKKPDKDDRLSRLIPAHTDLYRYNRINRSDALQQLNRFYKKRY